MSISALSVRALAWRPLRFDVMATEGTAQETAPVNVTRISFDAKTVYAIVAAAMAIVIAALSMAFSVRSDMAEMQADLRVMLARQEMQAEVDKAKAQINDNQLAGIKSSVEAFGRQLQLVQVENARLREIVLGQQKPGGDR